jgi:hypothetical protein
MSAKGTQGTTVRCVRSNVMMPSGASTFGEAAELGWSSDRTRTVKFVVGASCVSDSRSRRRAGMVCPTWRNREIDPIVLLISEELRHHCAAIATYSRLQRISQMIYGLKSLIFQIEIGFLQPRGTNSSLSNLVASLCDSYFHCQNLPLAVFHTY